MAGLDGHRQGRLHPGDWHSDQHRNRLLSAQHCIVRRTFRRSRPRALGRGERPALGSRRDHERGSGPQPQGSWTTKHCCAPRLAETLFRADVIRRRVTMKTQTTASGGVGLGRGGRLSRQRKRDAVLHLLRGEDLEILSRALGVTAATLSGWQQTFLAAGEASLATRPTNGDDLESQRLKAKLGEMLLERELLEAKIAALEANRPLARRRSRR